MYSKYNGVIYNIDDTSIAKEQKEYKRILKKYYNKLLNLGRLGETSPNRSFLLASKAE